MPTLEDIWTTLAQLVAGLLVAAVIVAIIRQAAFNQLQRREQRKFERSVKPKYEEHG